MTARHGLGVQPRASHEAPHEVDLRPSVLPLMATGPRIALATAGRFHVLDLARELCQLGEDVRFYSYVPKSQALRYGLPAHAQRRPQSS